MFGASPEGGETEKYVKGNFPKKGIGEKGVPFHNPGQSRKNTSRRMGVKKKGKDSGRWDLKHPMRERPGCQWAQAGLDEKDRWKERGWSPKKIHDSVRWEPSKQRLTAKGKAGPMRFRQKRGVGGANNNT